MADDALMLHLQERESVKEDRKCVLLELLLSQPLLSARIAAILHCFSQIILNCNYYLYIRVTL